uniref:alpha-1,2-Mannosidase n=1 Tax=Ciona savignyi TaxID=51511 RepID=H2YQP2_CIOSA
REQVKNMFYHAYNGYLDYAYPYDELRPLTCDGVNTWGSFSLTLIDALDTLAVLGNHSEFKRVATELINNIDFNINVNVSVFETNIRDMYLLAVFFRNTQFKSFFIYVLLNFLEVSTFEHNCLCNTATVVFQNWVGNHIDVLTGKWTAIDAGVGAGVDSFFEYLVKGAILLNHPELMDLFKDFLVPIEKYLKHGDWYMWANMNTGAVTMPVHQSLEAFWPGLQSLYGDTENAYKTILNYYQVWYKYGASPEFYSIPQAEPFKSREGYPLRPGETFYSNIVKIGVPTVAVVNNKFRSHHLPTSQVKDARDHRLDNRMESFFLAETIKYLYLLFDPGNPLLTTMKGATIRKFDDGRECVLGAGGHVFNTEAHPIDVSALHCCDTMRRETENSKIWNVFKNLDLKNVFKINRSRWEPNSVPWAPRTWANSRENRSIHMKCDAEPYHMKFVRHGQILSDD